MFAHRWPIIVGGLVALTSSYAFAQDLTQGKTPAQLFAGDCAACHKSPQGLARQSDARSVASFLREHYTTKPEMAEALAAYVVGAGGARGGQILDRPQPILQPNAKPRTAATGDGPKVPDGDSQKPSARLRPPGIVGDEAKPADAAKPAAKPRAAAITGDAEKPAGGDAPKPNDRSSDEDQGSKSLGAQRSRRGADDAAGDDAKSKRKASARTDDAKKPGEVGALISTGKLNTYARSNDKDESAENLARLREYATAGQGVPTAAGISLKPAVGSSAESTEDSLGEARRVSSANAPKIQLGDTPTAEGGPAAKGVDDQLKPTKPRRANDGKPQDASKPRRGDPNSSMPMSPTAFFGRLFSAGVKPQD